MRVRSADDAAAVQLAGRPLPAPDAVSAPFWAAAAAGRLVIQRCTRCGHHQFYPRPMCTECGADVEWVETSGTGEVHTFTVIRQNLAPPFGELGPYVVAMIELPEGPLMMSNVTDVDLDQVRVGLPVECYAVTVGDGLAIPFWRPRTA